MSIEVSAASISPPTQNVKRPEINRCSADFHPSIWGDHFLSYASNSLEKDDDDIEQEHQKLKNELKKMLLTEVDKPLEKFKLIDAIQRLGISYHFEEEIDLLLQQMQLPLKDCDIGVNDEDLYTISLKFRLFRQNGYNMSCDAFNKFKDSDGKFKEFLVKDVQGMLSLSEATHLRVHGEDILEQALAFTTTHLEAMATCLNSSVAKQICQALRQPIRKCLPRLEGRKYISVYQEDPSHSEPILTFAKLDFNMLQRLHQEEACEIAKWWKDMGFPRKLPFIRDRVIEGYFWSLGVYFEPEYALARRILTKVIAMISVFDDIYDVYGTIEELVLFTNAVERWDISEKDHLPEYMQICYQALLDLYKEIEEKMTKENLYRLDYAKEAMKNQVKAYFREAEWFHNHHVPTVEEYMGVALVSSVGEKLAIMSFVGMGDAATREALAWLFSDPKIVSASSIVGRLMNDIVSHKFEQKRGHVASSIECYMKQHGATEEEAVKELHKQIDEAWKDINEECLCPTAVPLPLLTRILNLARVSDFIYKDGDGYTNQVTTKDSVASVLIDPVPL